MLGIGEYSSVSGILQIGKCLIGDVFRFTEF